PADVIILRTEVERFEQKWNVFAKAGAAEAPKRVAGPGAPPKHDWDAFMGAVARRIHHHGLPAAQGELVREMMDWFDQRPGVMPPDERTVRRKISAMWRELT